MILRKEFCRVCGHDIAGRWPAQVCSTLCRATATREREARKEQKRKKGSAYYQRKQQRERQRRTAPRGILSRRALTMKMRRRLRKAAQRLAYFMCLPQRRRLRALRSRLAARGAIISLLRRRARETQLPYHQRQHVRELKRLREITPHYRSKARERHKKRAAQMIPIYALRGLGWLDGYDIIPEPRPIEPKPKPKHERRKPPTKYQKVIAAYAPQFQHATSPSSSTLPRSVGRPSMMNAGQKVICDQISMVFGMPAAIVSRDLRQRRGGNVGSVKKYIVDSQGNVVAAREVWELAYAPRAKSRERERRLKVRTVVAAFRELGLLSMES
jgi:hypothetical protein